ncbi:MAG: hypothetical protein ACYTF6_00725 [Planctomycetota bacterium]
MQPSLADAVSACRRDADFIAALRNVYTRVEAAVCRRGATCRACGGCCRFDETGCRLYVSAGELCVLLNQLPRQRLRGGRCPYQLGRLCTAREDRPLGCRTFFCGRHLRDWSQRLYESWHGRIKRLHEKHELPYLYVELTAGLNECL